MAHSAAPSRTQRTLELILAAVVLSAGITLAVVAILALEHPKGRAADSLAAASTPSSTSASGAATATPKATAAIPSGTAATPAAEPPVIILNATSDASLTGTADARIRARGWTVTRTGTFTGDILSTAVYFDPKASGAQQAAARFKAQFPAIKRALPKFTGLPSGPMILVLATDYS